MTNNLLRGSRIFPAATACLLLLGACGSGPGAPTTSTGTNSLASPTTPVLQPSPPATSPAVAGTPAAIDVCSLLTAAEIEAATGYEVAGSNPDPADGLSDCEWTLADEGGTIGLQVELDSSRAQKDHEFNCSVGFGLTELDGVGDSACADGIAGGTYLVYALLGDDQIALRMQADYEIDESAWATLANAAITRLP